MENNYLEHHGIKGMKWGVRRYQNRDGSLTKAGKRRYDKEMEKLKEEERVLKNKKRTQAKIDKLSAKRKELDDLRKSLEPETKKTKDERKVETHKQSIKDMSSDELKAAKDRLDLEKNYLDTLNSTRRETVNKGAKFAEKILDRVGENLLTQVGSHYGAKALNKIIGEEVIFANNKKK